MPVKALHLYEAQSIQEPFDAAFLAVKGYDTEWATMFILRFLKEPDGVIVDFQNGINDERVAAVAGRASDARLRHHHRRRHVRAGRRAADRPGRHRPRRVQDRRARRQDTERARKLVEAMNDVTLTKLTTNLFGERWSKMAANCMSNPLAGLSGYGTAEIEDGSAGARGSRSRSPPR